MTAKNIQAIDALANGQDGRHGSNPDTFEACDSSSCIVVARYAATNVC